jgi:predicted transcriptional regulator
MATPLALRAIIDHYGSIKAASAALGIDAAHLSRLAAGKLAPKAPTIARISRALDDSELARRLIDSFLADELDRLTRDLDIEWSRKGAVLSDYRIRPQ